MNLLCSYQKCSSYDFSTHVCVPAYV